MNPLKALHHHGQAAWLDFLARNFTAGGGLAKLVAEDGLTGVTSNPAIFEKAIADGADYDAAIAHRLKQGDCDAMALYEALAIEDIQHAADVLRPVYDATARADGYVSLEVSPYLALDTEATIAEGRRLWAAVGRENLMIKVPATPAGLPAVHALIGAGVNVNITLLFSRAVYEDVVEAYLGGLEDFLAQGGDPAKVASVASFFISRIDVAVEKLIAARLQQPGGKEGHAALARLPGKVAIAAAKLAYGSYKTLFTGARWEKLRAKGARVQRVLWASTGRKNPAYSDVLYIEELIAPDTVNTMPPATMEAFRDHGKVRDSLEENPAGADAVMAVLAQNGIAMEAVAAQLVDEGVQLFADAFDKLLGAVARKRAAVLGDALDAQQYTLPENLNKDLAATLDAWRRGGNLRRLWAGDASLWTGKDEAAWLGWLGVAERQQAQGPRLKDLAKEVAQSDFSHLLLLGMGGSSLGPEVLTETFGRREGYPELLVLDSTDPAQIRSFERRIDPARTLFIVSSKSGTTLEPNILKQYFFTRAAALMGPEKAGAHFIAITDPGSKLHTVAARDRFRGIWEGEPGIGGRYSVLSNFGMVPAAAMGLDTGRLLAAAQVMVRSCAASVPPEENPGVVLGAILGVAGRAGRDKVTIIASPGIADFAAWLEQLLAESTGKQGKGLIPVAGEPVGAPAVYGEDRVFAYLRLTAEADPRQDAGMDALEKAGHPVIRIAVADRYNIGQEFFRWEMATAVAGAILGINPFDQPDVEASKAKTRELTAAYEQSGALPGETPLFETAGIKVFAGPRHAEAPAGASLTDLLKIHFAQLGKGDYWGLLAYIARNEEHRDALQTIRTLVRDRKQVATCLGFGPRFLHSTGQAYKGGPNSGVFLQVTADDAADLRVPGQTYSFGIVKAAEARGDFDVLAERGRRLLRVHLANAGSDLKILGDAVLRALS